MGAFTINSNKIIAIFALLLVCFCAFSQDNTSSTVENPTKVDEGSIILNTSNTLSEEGATESGSSTLGLFFRMILVLIIIILLIYAFVWLLRKTSNQKIKVDPYLKEVANLTLVQGKSVRVITLKDRAYIIGVTDSNINLIAEVEDKDLIDAMNLNADEKPSDKPKDFASILSFFTKSTERTEDFIRKKREGILDSERDK